ncbi:MAG: formyltransferase family protein [Candidatus Methylomirabilales bacterium]
MGPTALTALESLAARTEVVGLVRETPDAAADPVRAAAERLGVPVTADAAPAKVEALIASLAPDCVVISSYNRILPPAVLARCPVVNVHYAPLPRYRGRANVNWAIINGEPCAAITIHQVVPELDAGPILFQQLIPVRAEDTVGDLYARLNAIQRDRLGETVLLFLGGWPGTPQAAADATYGCTRLPEDGEIEWRSDTAAILRLVRGLGPPYPGAFTYLRGRRLRVWRAAASPAPARYAGRVPGRVVGRSAPEGWVDVLTGDGVLRLLEVQADGEEPRAPAGLIRSIAATLGLSRGELLARIEALEREIARLKGETP